MRIIMRQAAENGNRISNSPDPGAAQAVENPRPEMAQKTRSGFGQKRDSQPLVIHVEGYPFVKSTAFYPAFKLRNPAPGFDCTGKTHEPGAGQPERGRKRNENL
jgi:hypothetical protein